MHFVCFHNNNRIFLGTLYMLRERAVGNSCPFIIVNFKNIRTFTVLQTNDSCYIIIALE